MKKKLGMILTGLCLMANSASATPINQMTENETAIGISSKDQYIERKFTPKMTIGYTRLDRDDYGKQNDAYLQYDVVGSEVKLIVGDRWHMRGMRSNVYGGLALSTPKVLGFEAYASYVSGKDFNEMQVGINQNIALNVNLNVNYHNFKPDHGKRDNGVGVGATIKF